MKKKVKKKSSRKKSSRKKSSRKEILRKKVQEKEVQERKFIKMFKKNIVQEKNQKKKFNKKNFTRNILTIFEYNATKFLQFSLIGISQVRVVSTFAVLNPCRMFVPIFGSKGGIVPRFLPGSIRYAVICITSLKYIVCWFWSTFLHQFF